MSGAGLKKCIPTTRPGELVAAAISVTDNADVFVASTASAPADRSSSAKSARFGSSSSTIASMTRSHDASSSTAVVVSNRASAASRASASSCPFSTLRPRKWPILALGALAELRRDLAPDHVEPSLERKLGDSGAHRAEPDDTDPGRPPWRKSTRARAAAEPRCEARAPRRRDPASPRRRTPGCSSRATSR